MVHVDVRWVALVSVIRVWLFVITARVPCELYSSLNYRTMGKLVILKGEVGSILIKKT